jgi:hypothetical protein
MIHDIYPISHLLQVQTDDQIVASQRDGSRKDPTSLSGGEKSFSTICLLLALWETLGCPIRCLGNVMTPEFGNEIDGLL